MNGGKIKRHGHMREDFVFRLSSLAFAHVPHRPDPEPKRLLDELSVRRQPLKLSSSPASSPVIAIMDQWLLAAVPPSSTLHQSRPWSDHFD